MRHHPTWREVREKYLSDPEVQKAAEELHAILEADRYAPVARDRKAERTRCEETIPGYREARLNG